MRFLVIFLLAISFSAEAVKHKSLSQMLIDQEAARQAEARRIAANKAAVAATLAAGGGR